MGSDRHDVVLWWDYLGSGGAGPVCGVHVLSADTCQVAKQMFGQRIWKKDKLKQKIGAKI